MSIAKSNLVTNRDAAPRAINPPGDDGGKVHVAKGYASVVAADLDANDIILLADIPIDAKVEGVWLKNTDLDTNATETIEFDVGVFTTAGVAKDSNAYFDGSVDGAALFEDANKNWVDVFYKAASAAGSNGTSYLWEDAGDTSRPTSTATYTVGILLAAAAATAAATGTVEFKIHYSFD